jgi:tetratricopeptide (TPR) repeat protein
MIRTLSFFYLLFIWIFNVNSQEETLLKVANNKLLSRNFEGAIQDYNQLISIKADNIEALCGRAEARLNLGNYPEALKDAEIAINVDNKNARALTLKGDAFFYLKDYSNALKMYNQAIQLQNPPYFQAIIGRAKVMNQLGNIKDAYRILDDAIDQQPSNPEFYYARGLLNSTKEKYAKAIQDFEKAVVLNPGFNPFGIALNSGIAHLNLDEAEKAIEWLNKAIEIDPRNATAYQTRGLAHYAQEEFKEAADDFLKSHDINPANHNTLYNLGMSYYKLNDRENACLYFHKSCQAGNTDACKMVVLACETKR